MVTTLSGEDFNPNKSRSFELKSAITVMTEAVIQR